MVSFFFLDEVPYDDAAFAKTIANDDVGKAVLDVGDRRLRDGRLERRRAARGDAAAGGVARAWRCERVRRPIRCAVTGTSVGPPLFESMELLGREAVLERLRGALVRAGA